ncbi:MAG TPA: GlxA family transcriptional regulator [Nitrosospira sp.]|nr:GlxA family transcriptional regulator [Nitrosospira sp.]
MLRIGMVVIPEFQMMYFAAISAFEIANMAAKEKIYDVHTLSEEGGLVASSLGMPVQTLPFGDQTYDTILVGGAIEIKPTSGRVTQFLRDAHKKFRRVGSVCTGAFALADAGLLDGRRATTHWLYAHDLQKRYPRIKVEEDRIFIIDGSVWTSAGMTAGIDLALGMIEKDYGADLARLVAKQMVVYHRRGGGQSQHSALLEMDAKSDRIQAVLEYAKKNLKSALNIEELADVAHLSPRQFSRAFQAETRQSPAKAIENLRLEAARLMMEQSRHSIEFVAAETGFGDRERMRRAFLRAYGQPPQVIRRSARSTTAA